MTVSTKNPLNQGAIVPAMQVINQFNAITGRDINALGVQAAQPFSSPKYARHRTNRHHEFEDTMARMFIQVPSALYEKFLASLTDKETADIARVLTGDNVQQGGIGYIDFFLQRAHHALNDKYQVIETLSDSYVAFFFGLQAPVFSYTGTLMNTYQDDWTMRMLRIFNELGRGTQLARRGFIMRLRYDSLIVNGAMTNFEWDLMGEGEMSTPFSFNLLVKSVQIVYGGLRPPTNLRHLGFKEFEPQVGGSTFVAGTGEASKSFIGGPATKPEGVSDNNPDPQAEVDVNPEGVTQNFDSETGQTIFDPAQAR